MFRTTLGMSPWSTSFQPWLCSLPPPDRKLVGGGDWKMAWRQNRQQRPSAIINNFHVFLKCQKTNYKSTNIAAFQLRVRRASLSTLASLRSHLLWFKNTCGVDRSKMVVTIRRRRIIPRLWCTRGRFYVSVEPIVINAVVWICSFFFYQVWPFLCCLPLHYVNDIDAHYSMFAVRFLMLLEVVSLL